MWDFASIVERTRRASASVSRLEAELARDPNSAAVQINLAASKKRALQSNEELQEIARYQSVDICHYRLIPQRERSFFVEGISKSLLEYQHLFSQIYDAIKNGAKGRAQIGKEAAGDSALALAFTYSGSLGIVLLAPSERDFFQGKLDSAIDALYSIAEVDSSAAIREVAQNYGGAVIKRLHDWSEANIEGGYSADIRWNRSDGRHLGSVFDVSRMERLVELSVAASDKKTDTDSFVGILVGGDLNSGSFHFVVPNGRDFRGSLAEEFSEGTEMTLGKRYAARIREATTTVYATEKVDRKIELLSLSEPPTVHFTASSSEQPS